jgi:hypothetical protein
MPVLLWPLIVKLVTFGLDLFASKSAEKSALRKKIDDKLAELDQRAKDSSVLRAEYKKALDELLSPKVDDKTPQS